MAKMKIYEISRSLQGAFPDLKSKDLIKLLSLIHISEPTRP